MPTSGKTSWLTKTLIAAAGIALLGILFTFYHDTTEVPHEVAAQDKSSSTQQSQAKAGPDKGAPQHSPAASTNAQTPSASGLAIENEPPEVIPEALISEVAASFGSVEEVLQNLDHPKVVALMADLPEETRKMLKIAALKQSVSKRLDSIEKNPASPIELAALNQDIDTLAENLVMMPQEARNLKAYLKQHTKK